MEIIKIGLYLKDKDFAKALCKALMRESKAMIFQIVDEVNTNTSINLFITDHTQNPLDNGIYLVDSIDKESLDTSPLCLFKYRESSQIMKALFFIIFQMTGKVIEYRGNRKTNVLTLCQLGGGQGCTSVSLGLIHFLQSSYNKKCIYINLNIVNDSFNYINEKETVPPLKLAYYLERNKDFPIVSFTEKDGDIEFINCGRRNVGINAMALLQKLEKEGYYDFIICDIGSSWTKRNLEVLENSDCIISINAQRSLMSQAFKKNNWDYIMVLAGNVPIIPVTNFVNEEVDIEDMIHITEDENAFYIKDGKINMDFHRNYGNEIQWICNRVMEATYEVK